ncbi:DsbA family protein [Candidatus Peregrinibacteria bacterium]|nr:DsbA family protein [Candidatus Peregrinibacteria bacterium]
MSDNQDIKRFALWFLVTIVIIGSFVAIMFLSKTPDVTPGKLSTPVKADEWIRGTKDARVTLVEYSDLQCPACRAWEPEVQSLLSEFGTHMRFVYRHYPLRQIHKNSQIATQAAEAAGLQGKFWEMHDIMFGNQATWSPQPPDVVKATFADYAKQIGLNVDQFNKDLDSGKVKDLVEEDVKSGDAAGVNSTPSFFLNGTQLNPKDNDDFRKLIRDAVNAIGKSA